LAAYQTEGVEMSFVWKDVVARDWKYDIGLNLTV
jgi:hypothetical protein